MAKSQTESNADDTLTYRLLLVEDNPGDADLICDEFASLPGRFDIVCATGLEKALVVLESTDVDAVILDLNLPDSTGIDTLRRIRRVRDDVAVIVTSGGGYGAIREMVLEEGALDFASKTAPAAASIARSALYAIERHRVQGHEGRFGALTAHNPDSVVVVDAHGIVLFANDAALQLFGRRRAEFVGGALGVGVGECESTIVDVPLMGRKAEMHASPCEWDGRVAHLATFRDVTDREALAERLQQSRKMEAVGLLAGGIAHDFNNLLTAINGYAALGLDRVHREDPLGEYFREIGRAGERAASLTRQLLAFSRKQVLQPRVVDLNQTISALERMLRRLIGEDIVLTTSLDPALWRVVADPSQIEQVLLNLALNARDAMPRGGRLTFTTRNVVLDEASERLHLDAAPGPHVVVAVDDTGCGMDSSTMAHIFDPFFTTKEVGKGTGLGLATVYGIVRQSGGSIAVRSEVDAGATFEIYLPRAEEADAVVSEKAIDDPVRSLRGTETVLIAEDELLVRTLARQILEALGYTVIEAASGDAALAVYESHHGHIDLLLTDVVMPGMSGPDLVERLRGVLPSLRVIYMSGYADDALARHGVLDGGTVLLHKPFSPDVLLRCVRRVLDGPEPL